MAVSGQQINLSYLNYYMKTRDSGHIEPADFVWSNLRDDLKARISSEEIDGEMVKEPIGYSKVPLNSAEGNPVNS